MTVNFGSDNSAPVKQEILDALQAANKGDASSYGEDGLSQSLNQRFSDIFEKEVQIFPVLSGTAANAISLSQITSPYGAVLCHEHSHINIDECGAVEFFSGGKLVLLSGAEGKLIDKEVEKAFLSAHPHDYHNSKLSTVSLTQATEYGTVYSIDEVQSIASIARAHDAHVHMDGARFANALDTLQCTPAALTWQAGVDILSFGSSKNGTMNAEAIVVFDPEHATELLRRIKRAGQLVSKMRYISCQLDAYLEDDRWLTWATHSNTLAKRLAEALDASEYIEVMFPPQSNILILRMDNKLAEFMCDKGVEFYPWHEVDNCYRVVLSNLHDEADISFFTDVLGGWNP
jgi:threonine aldolase